MLRTFAKARLVHVAPALALCSAFLLAGCQYDEAAEYVDPQASAFYERHPIKVKRGTAKIGIAAHSDKLNEEQVRAVANFAADAKSNARSRISLQYPSGSPALRQAAVEAANLMIDQGVPETMIRMGSYPGGHTAPLRISYETKVAVTKECGDWSEDIAFSPQNEDYPNFGCSQQQNIAALVADPEDFERPRAQSPVMAANRTMALSLYLASPTAVTSTANTSVDIQHSTGTTLSGASN